MKLTVFGASGAIGRQVVRQALDAGHKVTAVVRQTARFELRHPCLQVVTVPSLTDPESLREAVSGSDAAISGVGPRRRSDMTVASSTTRVILQALQDNGIRRFVAVSAAPVGPVPEGDSFFNRRILFPVVGAILRPIYADLALMERDIMRSVPEWTIVRPPRLTNSPLSGRYRTVIGGNVPRGMVISRADTAHAMLAALENPATINQAIGVAR